MKNKNLWWSAGAFVGAAALGYGVARRYRRLQSERLAWQRQHRPGLDVLACPACPVCKGLLAFDLGSGFEGYTCQVCQVEYPLVAGIPHFVQMQALTGQNRRFAKAYDWFSRGYRLFCKVAFAYIGISEERARREITDRLQPKGGRVLEVSIGPGVNLPFLVGRPDVGEIFGLDLSLGQLNRCREYIAHMGWDVQLQLGNAEQLPYQDNTFDGVFHIGGINFFDDKQKAIDEMIRVARPGTRILICDETEQGAKAYEHTLPGFKRMTGKTRPAVLPPLDLVPPEMQEVRLFDVWKGWMYCIEFSKPEGQYWSER